MSSFSTRVPPLLIDDDWIKSMNNVSSPFIAAVVQAAPDYLNLDGTVDKTVARIEEAARAGAKLVVFPEAWLPGYPFWAWMDSPLWGLQWADRYAANSIELDSDQERRIAAAAAQHEIHVVVGCSEKRGASLFMSQLIFDASGGRSVRRKLKPTHAERLVFGEGSGADLIVRETELGRLGAFSCWEHLQPLFTHALIAQNVQILAGSWPSYSMYRGAHLLSADFNDAISQVVAGQAGCFVLAASAVTTPEMIGQLCTEERHRDLIWPGGGRSMIFAPDGSRMAKYLAPDEEGLVYAELDLNAIGLAKAVFDPAGHSGRPDVVRAVLDGRPLPSLETLPSPADAGVERQTTGDEEDTATLAPA